jgi:hypothetical protein
LIAQASVQNKDERYITESQTRIGRSSSAYVEVARLQQMVNTSAAASRSAERSKPAAPAATPVPAPGSRGETMTNAEVIELRTAGLDDDNLIAAIKEAKSVNFDLSPAGLRALLQAKVSNRVITAMRARK